MTIVWRWRAAVEGSHTQNIFRESEQPAKTEVGQNSRSYIVLKVWSDTQDHASLLTQYLLIIDHSLHQRNACSSWNIVYINTILISINHGLHQRIISFLVITLLILSTVGCIYQQHPPGLSEVKAICFHRRWVIEVFLLDVSTCKIYEY